VSQTRLGVVPGLRFGCRANHDKDIELLYQLGAREVVQPEFEAGLELATHLLTGMGFCRLFNRKCSKFVIIII